jgi:hypothetical protein
VGHIPWQIVAFDYDPSLVLCSVDPYQTEFQLGIALLQELPILIQDAYPYFGDQHIVARLRKRNLSTIRINPFFTLK